VGASGVHHRSLVGRCLHYDPEGHYITLAFADASSTRSFIERAERRHSGGANKHNHPGVENPYRSRPRSCRYLRVSSSNQRLGDHQLEGGSEPWILGMAWLPRTDACGHQSVG
jgi:hypothetical protein